MKNIEKYKDEIKSKIKEKSTLDCAIADLRGNACDECFRCTNCGLKSLDWLLEEYEKPLLTDEGINFLKEHIKQSGAIAVYIKITKKVDDYCDYCLEIHLETALISIPFAKRSNLYEMFKNVEIGQDYLPEELGL